MATNTTRLGLVKPLTTEDIDVTILNSNADKLDAVAGYTLCTASTRPAAPFSGQQIRETDTGKTYFSNGSSPASASWVQVPNSATSWDLPSSASATWAGDTNLFRSAANVLKTDDSLTVAGNLTVSGSATFTGAISGSVSPVMNSFTPTFSGGGFTNFGSGASVQGWYTQQGKLVTWGFRIELGSTGLALSGNVLIDLPVAAFVWGGLSLQATLGQWTIRDTSAGKHFAGSLAGWAADGLSASFSGAWVSGEPSGRVNATNLITFASGDVLSGGGSYRAA